MKIMEELKENKAMKRLVCEYCGASLALGRRGSWWRFGCISCTKGTLYNHPKLDEIFLKYFAELPK